MWKIGLTLLWSKVKMSKYENVENRVARWRIEKSEDFFLKSEKSQNFFPKSRKISESSSALK